VEPNQILQEIAGQVSGCTLCQLSLSRKKAVPGEGPGNVEIILIGEGPGFYENEQGRPFVGPAGNFLNELLQKAGVSRGEVFITNVVKCRPPGNRDPLPDELSACNVFLDRQIEVINPLVIVTLGRYSMAKFLPNVRISEVHGQPAWVRGRLVVPMFHPAAALHQPSLKSSVERDFTRLPEWIQQAHHSGHQAPGSQMVEDKHPSAISGSQPEPTLFDLNTFSSNQEEDIDETNNLPQKGRPTQLNLF